MLIVAAACGGKVADDFTHIDVVNGSSSSSSGGSSSSSSGGAASSCITPRPGPCAFMLGDGAKDTPEASTVVTDASCKTSLYLLTMGSRHRIRRYEVIPASGPFGCVLDPKPDTDAEVESAGALAANALGHVYVARPGSLARIVEGAAVACSGPPIPGTPGSLAMSPDGGVAYAVYDAEPKGSGVRAFVIKPRGERACTVSSFAREGGPSLSDQRGIAVDAQGRVHIASGLEKPRVVIYGSLGKFVQEYGSFTNVSSMTSCKGGLCIDELRSVKVVEDDGTFRADLPYKPSAPLGGLVQLAGAPRGPLLLVGQNDETKGTSIDVLAVP